MPRWTFPSGCGGSRGAWRCGFPMSPSRCWPRRWSSRGHIVPVVENPLGTAAGRQLQVRQQEISDDYHIRLVEQGLQIDGIEITPLLGKVSALVEDISGTAAHSSSEISAAGAEHQNDAVGHVDRKSTRLNSSH